MRAEELRKGNFVNTYLNTTEGKLYTRGTIQALHMNTAETENNVTHPYNLLEGVEINDEWFTKFGFAHTKGAHTSWIEKEVEEGWIFSIQYLRAKNHAFYGRTEIKYVHELQNLYYVLSGRELILNNFFETK